MRRSAYPDCVEELVNEIRERKPNAGIDGARDDELGAELERLHVVKRLEEYSDHQDLPAFEPLAASKK